MLIGLFAFGVLASGLAAISLLDPGGVLEPMWRINPRGHNGFARIGLLGPVLLAVVCMACAATAIGLVRVKGWGYWAAIAMLSFNLLADMFNVLSGTEPRAVVGLPVVGALLWFLSRTPVRAYFKPRGGDA
jgi:hypothetical protein